MINGVLWRLVLALAPVAPACAAVRCALAESFARLPPGARVRQLRFGRAQGGHHAGRALRGRYAARQPAGAQVCQDHGIPRLLKSWEHGPESLWEER